MKNMNGRYQGLSKEILKFPGKINYPAASGRGIKPSASQ